MNPKSYIDISARLRAEIPTLVNVDIFNNQYVEPELHDPITCPSVFVEWMPTVWSDSGAGVQEGSGGFRIHCVVSSLGSTQNIDLQTEEDAEANLAHFEFVKQVHAALQGFAPCGYNAMQRMRTIPDHQYTGIVAIVHEYAAQEADASAYVYRDYTMHEVEDFIVEKGEEEV